MFSAFLLFNVLFGLCVWSGEFNFSADTRIIYSPAFGHTVQKGFRGHNISVNDIREGGQSTLDKIIRREMLAGYRFIPGIATGNWRDADWWTLGLRDELTDTVPFFSQQLTECILSIVRVLGLDFDHLSYNQRDCIDLAHPFWGVLRYEHRVRLFPPKKVRQWSIVPAENVFLPAMRDQLFIVLQGEKKALEGVLRAYPGKIVNFTDFCAPVRPAQASGAYVPDCCELPMDACNLLKLDLLRKRLSQKTEEEHEGDCRAACGSQAQKLLKNPSYPKWNVGVLYFDTTGAVRSGLFDFSLVSATVTRSSPQKNMLEALKEEEAFGLKLKNSRIVAPEYVAILKRPEVSRTTCHRVKWRSVLLSRTLSMISDFWDKPGFRDVSKGLWRFDAPAILEGVFGELWWSVIDDEAFTAISSGARSFSRETVLISVHGVLGAFKGQRSWL